MLPASDGSVVGIFERQGAKGLYAASASRHKQKLAERLARMEGSGEVLGKDERAGMLELLVMKMPFMRQDLQLIAQVRL